MNNSSSNNYESEIKKLRDELNIEKNNNKALKIENKKLNDIINSMKTKNIDLTNKIKVLEEQLNKLRLDLQNYKSNNTNSNININNSLKINSNNINDLIVPLLPGEKIMTLIFNTQGTQYIVSYGLACKNTNLFVRLEEILNNEFPDLKKHDTYFEVNKKRIKRFQTLEENGIKNNDLINIFLIDI